MIKNNKIKIYKNLKKSKIIYKTNEIRINQINTYRPTS